MRHFLSCVLTVASALSAAEPVTQKINVLDLMKSGQVEYHINPKADFHDPADQVFQLKEDLLHISGKGYGYMVTKEGYKDYHLVVEFKWGPKTWGKREDRARDNGILVHGYGPHGAYGDTWMASIEAQIIEGGIGDILVLSPKLADGTELVTSLKAEFELDRDKEKRWKKGAPLQEVNKGRINWEKRDEDWADKINFRGKDDPDSPVGEWNRLEVIAKGETLQYFVNGLLLNEAFECKPAEGRICIQTEGAEMIVRRYELHPLGQFKEKWNPIQASGGSDVSVRDGQTAALSPEESLKLIQFDGDYEAQLVAAEPLVLDPVEVTWDAEGRMYVADMRDYPLGPEPGKPALSRVQLLTDEDGDGRMDKAVTFADHVDHVQGLLPYNGGLIATTRTQILFLKDTDGDGKADVNEPLIKGFNPRHSQLQVSAPRWGPDGCVHFNNGLDAKEIYPADAPAKVVGVPGANFKWNPKTGEITPTGGKGQYGGAFDDWGHHFYCSNRNPLMFTVMPWSAMLTNPHAGITQNYEDIAPAGPETRVYPLKITHTTADAHAGTNTACSGLGVYRGDVMPELKNNVFVPDPTGQLITRYKVEPNGASLKATRVGERTEFFRSADEWSRPVNITTGPDGALYVCDIYRRWIDHARFFPEEFVKAHDMRQGENEGRIWRIVKKGSKASKIGAAPEEISELIAWLGHENAWQRETAQRLLIAKVEKNAEQVLSALETMKKKDGMGEPYVQHVGAVTYAIADKLGEESVGKRIASIQKTSPSSILSLIALSKGDHIMRPMPGVTSKLLASALKTASFSNENYHGMTTVKEGQRPLTRGAVLASYVAESPSDPWVLKAVLSGASGKAGQIMEYVIDPKAWESLALKPHVDNPGTPDFDHKPSAAGSDFVRQLVITGLVTGDNDDLILLFKTLSLKPGQMVWWKPAFLQGLSEGLPKSGGKLGVKSLVEFIAKPPKGYEAAAKEIAALQSKIDAIVADPKAPLDQRLAVLPLLGSRKWEAVQPVVKKLLTSSQPAELTGAALSLLKRYPAPTTAPLIYEVLPNAGPALKRDLVPLLTGNATTALAFFKRMEQGEFPTAWVDVETRWRYQRGTGEMATLAKKLFGEASSDRAAVVKDYMAATSHAGDPVKGQQVFATICITCHRHGSLGVDVGPPLSDVKVKPPEALLADILDPNRMFEARWSAYQVDTTDGRVLSGLIQSETTDAIVLVMMGGMKETLPRSAIKTLKSLDRSLMPPGLEAAITKEQMTDLLAFLTAGK